MSRDSLRPRIPASAKYAVSGIRNNRFYAQMRVPAAMRQAHERIIGERPVANADKILSLYESDIHVIARGKAGADVEFGNSLFVAETVSGFILDHELGRDTSPGDAKWLHECGFLRKSEKPLARTGGSASTPSHEISGTCGAHRIPELAVCHQTI
ncbi:MAG: hypothetical protein WC076_12350 [Terrimicrobiaceae bacterium]